MDDSGDARLRQGPGWPGRAGVHRFPRLRPGDRVGVAAPGFAVRPDLLAGGLVALGRMGYEVVVGRSLTRQAGYLAGSDEERADDLNRFLQDPAIRAVWFARGGYGTARLLDRVDWEALARDPKLLVGYSDLTALFAAATKRPGQLCLYAPVVTELGDGDGYHAPSLRAALRGEPFSLPMSRGQVLAPGRAEGPLAGGNLTVLVHLLGTRYEPDLRGAVLFLEDTAEETYRLDRLLGHLRMAGALSRVAAVLLGSFEPKPTERAFPPDRPIEDVLAETFLPLGVPVVAGLRAGHVPGKWTLPIGGLARLDTEAGGLVLEPRPAFSR